MTENTVAPIKCGFSHLHGTPVLAVPALTKDNEELKRVMGATFFPELSVWLFPGFFPYIADVVHDLKIVIPDIVFTPEVEEQLARCAETAKILEQHPIPAVYRPDFKFVTQPRQHQEEALNFALLLPRCAIFHDCGLGKSKVIVDLVRHEREKTLILTPTVGITMWLHEIELHSGGELNAIRIIGAPKEKRKAIRMSPDFDIVIVGYDTAKRYYKPLIQTFAYTLIVADESHMLRGEKSGRTKAAIALSARASRRIIMSGTPSLGNPLHFWGQLYFLGRYIPSVDAWTFRKHFTLHAKHNRRFIIGFKNLGMLNEKVNRIAVRKTKEECLDLPPRQIVDVPFIVSNEQRRIYNELVDAACTELKDGTLYEAAHAAAVIQKLLQVLSGIFIKPLPEICNGCENLHACVEERIKPYTRRCSKEQVLPPQSVYIMKKNPKLDALKDLLDSILAEERNKVIIWAHFVAELDVIAEMLQQNDIRFVRVDGSNSGKAADIAKEFNEDTGIRVYLANIATGTALTLTSAAYMIYFNLTYKLDEYLQSLDRNYRIGQESPVVVYRFVVPESILGYVAAALERKLDIATVLTTKINCVLCPHGERCIEHCIEPFSKDCIHHDRAICVITRPQKL